MYKIWFTGRFLLFFLSISCSCALFCQLFCISIYITLQNWFHFKCCINNIRPRRWTKDHQAQAVNYRQTNSRKIFSHQINMLAFWWVKHQNIVSLSIICLWLFLFFRNRLMLMWIIKFYDNVQPFIEIEWICKFCIMWNNIDKITYYHYFLGVWLQNCLKGISIVSWLKVIWTRFFCELELFDWGLILKAEF